MDSQPSSQTSSYHVANVSPDPTVNAPTVNAPPVNAPPVNAPPVNANVSTDRERPDGEDAPEKFDDNFQKVLGASSINMDSQPSSQTSSSHVAKPTVNAKAIFVNKEKIETVSSKKGKSIQKDNMSNNQIKQTIATTDGNDLTTAVSSTPATHYDDGKPKWRYASGATEVGYLCDDNLLPRTALKKDGSTGKTFNTENVKMLTQGNYNKNYSFKGWTAINKLNNARQSRVKCPHCNGFFKKGSLSKHQRSSKCVNAEGVQFVVGEHVSHVNTDGTEVMGRVSSKDAPAKVQFATTKSGYRTSPLDWTGAEAYLAQLPSTVLAKLLVGEMAVRYPDVTKHNLCFNFTKPPTAPANYKPSIAGQVEKKSLELKEAQVALESYRDELEQVVDDFNNQCKDLATKGDYTAIANVVSQQKAHVALEETLTLRVAELTDELELAENLAEEEVTHTPLPHIGDYDLATPVPVAPVSIIKRKPKVAEPTAEVAEPTAEVTEPIVEVAEPIVEVKPKRKKITRKLKKKADE